MFCANCNGEVEGKKNADDEIFCEFCGEKLIDYKGFKW